MLHEGWYVVKHIENKKDVMILADERLKMSIEHVL